MRSSAGFTAQCEVPYNAHYASCTVPAPRDLRKAVRVWGLPDNLRLTYRPHALHAARITSVAPHLILIHLPPLRHAGLQHSVCERPSQDHRPRSSMGDGASQCSILCPTCLLSFVILIGSPLSSLSPGTNLTEWPRNLPTCQSYSGCSQAVQLPCLVEVWLSPGATLSQCCNDCPGAAMIIPVLQ